MALPVNTTIFLQKSHHEGMVAREIDNFLSQHNIVYHIIIRSKIFFFFKKNYKYNLNKDLYIYIHIVIYAYIINIR